MGTLCNKKNLSIFLFFLIVLICCSKKNKTFLEQENFKLSFVVLSPVKNNFELFYSLEDSLGFSEERKLTESVNVKNKKIEFILPTNKIPKNIRLDFPNNKNYVGKTVIITDFVIEYKGQTINLENEDLNLFFTRNEFVKGNKPGRYVVQQYEGRFDPYLLSTPYFKQRLKLEFLSNKKIF